MVLMVTTKFCVATVVKKFEMVVDSGVGGDVGDGCDIGNGIDGAKGANGVNDGDDVYGFDSGKCGNSGDLWQRCQWC